MALVQGVRRPVGGAADYALSANGTLAYVTGGENDGDLWSYDLGGRPQLPLALPQDNRFPVWSPDGKQVAFAVLSGGRALSTMAADGSALTPRRIRDGNIPGVPHVWSADGDLLVVTGVVNPDISAVRADGTGEARPIVASEYREIDPALSPDGRWLAYVSDRTGSDEIWSGLPGRRARARVERRRLRDAVVRRRPRALFAPARA